MQFTKMHGLGNDFIVIDATKKAVDLDTKTIRHLADRHYGIGCDQILVLEPATKANTDFSYRIFNAGGDEAEQ